VSYTRSSSDERRRCIAFERLLGSAHILPSPVRALPSLLRESRGFPDRVLAGPYSRTPGPFMPADYRRRPRLTNLPSEAPRRRLETNVGALGAKEKGRREGWGEPRPFVTAENELLRKPILRSLVDEVRFETVSKVSQTTVAWSQDGPKRNFFNPSRLRIPARFAIETLLEPLFIQSLIGVLGSSYSTTLVAATNGE
jgi:hypothetical protein